MRVLAGGGIIPRSCDLSPRNSSGSGQDRDNCEVGEAIDSYRGAEFPGFGKVLSTIRGGFLQDGESSNTTHQKGPAILVDR